MNKLLTYIILIIFASAGCGDDDSIDELIAFAKARSMNDMGDETELLKLAQKGDTDAYDDLAIAYLDFPRGDFLPIAIEMAGKYDYPIAYHDVYSIVLDTGKVYPDEPIDALDKKSIDFALDYLISGAKKGDEQCLDNILSYYLIDSLYYKHINNSDFLKRKHGTYIDSLSQIKKLK